MSDYNLEKILPHKPPMILLDDIKKVDIENKTLTAIYIPSKDKIFFDKTHNGISSVVAIELMAQTIGCYAFFRNNRTEPEIGFLLGSRLLEISIDYFELGKTYSIMVKEIFTDNNISSFDCIIYNEDNEEIASAAVNVYQDSENAQIQGKQNG